MKIHRLLRQRVSQHGPSAEVSSIDHWAGCRAHSRIQPGLPKQPPAPRQAKVLLDKEQIIKIHKKVKEGRYTLVPLSIYFEDGDAKVELAVAKGKREAGRAISARKNLGDY